MRSKPLFLPALFLILIAVPAHAEEGMWTFDNFPAQAVKDKYGIAIDKAWLDHVQGATVRLAGVGCSASVVSKDGLVLTNHHCVSDCVQNVSISGHDYEREGFSAPTLADERKCPGTEAEILLSITDVTKAVNQGTAGKSGRDFTRARDAAIAVQEKSACGARDAKHRCQVISFYQGGQYKLYRYRRYSDVRLAFVPEFQAAFFGGDPDNFNFPRYDLDCAFIRLYDDGKPASIPNPLHMSTEAPKDGELVFVAGNPGSTSRLLTAPQLVSLRDNVRADYLVQASELRGRYTRFTQESADNARIAGVDLFYLENTIKSYRGQQLALSEPSLIAAKAAADADLKAKVAAMPALAKEIGDPWSEIETALNDVPALYKQYSLLEVRAGFGSGLLSYARTIVRAAAERKLPNAERLPDYTDTRLPQNEKRVLDNEPIEPSLEQVKLEFWLSKLREYLTADAPETTLFLGKDSPETLSRALVQSQIGDPAYRKALWDGGESAVNASTDPMILFVRKTDAASRAARKAYEQRVQGPIDRAQERIAKARFAVYGTSVYPDATFSLRLSYGTIQGWQEPGHAVPAFTDFAGLYKRATGQTPYDLSPKWQAAEKILNPNTVFDISSTNDIIGGNSGSPLIDAKGEVIGAIFDGNIHSLGGTFFYDPALNRTVSVSAVAILDALSKVYGETRLVAELTAR